MQYVTVSTNEELISNQQGIRGYLTSYNGIKLNYILSKIFEESNNISERTLQRYRNRVMDEVAIIDQPLYFSQVCGGYYYTDRILEYRKHNISFSLKPDTKGVTYTIDCNKNKLISKECLLYKRIEKFNWGYACGSSYKKKVSIEECVAKMHMLHEALIREFKDSSVTMFYITEHDEERKNVHNHFVVTVNGTDNRNVKRRIRSTIRCTGAKAPFTANFKTEEPDYLVYMMKYIHEYPDGWAILSNSKKEIDQLTPCLST